MQIERWTTIVATVPYLYHLQDWMQGVLSARSCWWCMETINALEVRTFTSWLKGSNKSLVLLWEDYLCFIFRHFQIQIHPHAQRQPKPLKPLLSRTVLVDARHFIYPSTTVRERLSCRVRQRFRAWYPSISQRVVKKCMSSMKISKVDARVE